MKQLLLICWLIPSILSFCQDSISTCQSQLRELYLKPVNAILKIPAYEITDSVREGDHCLLNYSIRTKDSSFTSKVVIYDVGEYPDQVMDQVIKDQGKLTKQMIDKKDFAIIYEKEQVINGIKIGFLKTKSTWGKENFRILYVYFYKDKKQVDIILQETIDEKSPDQTSLVDCIAKSLSFR